MDQFSNLFRPGSIGTLELENRLILAAMGIVRETLGNRALERGIELSDLSVTRPSLEDIYLQLTGDTVDG